MDFAKRLLDWNNLFNHRKMPWKGETDPYKIWLSEIILQQTRVEQGWDYYEKFISRFPNIISLANAEDEEVMKLWEGLGYYSRCRNLLKTARDIAFGMGGVFPDKASELKKLKGIGDYTSAAIASFAFKEPIAVVDGNVQRLLSRIYEIKEPIDTVKGKNSYQKLANELLCRENPGVYNQAIMDFGATVCLPRNPLCNNCVFNSHCKAFKLSLQHELPVKSKRIIKKNRWLNYFIVQHNNEILIRKRKGNDIWKGLYEFVLLETTEKPEMEKIKTCLSEMFLTEIQPLPYLFQKKQQLTHQTIHGSFMHVILDKKTSINGYHFEKIDKLKIIPFPGLINSYLTDKPLQKTTIQEK